MDILNRLLHLVGSVLPAVLLGVVLVVVSADVVARTVFSQSVHVSHDVAILALAGVVWFGIVGIALNGELFGVQFFVDLLPERGRRAVHVLVHVLVILISAAVLRAAVAQVQTARFTQFLTLGWPKWIVSAGLGIAMALVIVIQVIQLVKLLRRRAGR